MVTDPVSDMLIRVKNAALQGKSSTLVPHSKFKHEIANLLVREGYLSGVELKGKRVRKFLELTITYKDKAPRMTDIKRISKSSRRIYKGSKELRSVRDGFGMAVLSTPKGLLTDKEARKQKVGGEVLFQIW